MRIGFTGTREGITDAQAAAVTSLLIALAPTEAHHGDCIGADAQFHGICLALHIPIVVHPPIRHDRRAFASLCSGS